MVLSYLFLVFFSPFTQIISWIWAWGARKEMQRSSTARASSPTAVGRPSPTWGSLPSTPLHRGALAARGGALTITSSAWSVRASWVSPRRRAAPPRRRRPRRPTWVARRQTWSRCTARRCPPTPPAATCTRSRSPSTTAPPPARPWPTPATSTTLPPSPPWMAACSP